LGRSLLEDSLRTRSKLLNIAMDESPYDLVVDKKVAVCQEVAVVDDLACFREPEAPTRLHKQKSTQSLSEDLELPFHTGSAHHIAEVVLPGGRQSLR
jgi:hypothetical protein